MPIGTDAKLFKTWGPSLPSIISSIAFKEYFITKSKNTKKGLSR